MQRLERRTGQPVAVLREVRRYVPCPIGGAGLDRGDGKRQREGTDRRVRVTRPLPAEDGRLGEEPVDVAERRSGGGVQGVPGECGRHLGRAPGELGTPAGEVVVGRARCERVRIRAQRYPVGSAVALDDVAHRVDRGRGLGEVALGRTAAGGGQQTLRRPEGVAGPAEVIDEVVRHGRPGYVLRPQAVSQVQGFGQRGEEQVEVAGGGRAVRRRGSRCGPEPGSGGVEELVKRRHHCPRTAASDRAAAAACSAASLSWTSCSASPASARYVRSRRPA